MEEKNVSALNRAKIEFKSGDPFLMADCSGAQYSEKGEGEGVFKLKYLNQDYLVKYPDGDISFADENKESKLEQKKTGCGRLPGSKETADDEKVNDYGIDYSGGTILISDQVLMLYYLIKASGLPSRGKLINFLELPQGGHHYSCFIEDAINPLVNRLAGKEENFYKGIDELGGKKNEMGDYGGIIDVFPKISQTFIIWEGDDEFPPKGNILFDSVIPTYLDTASIYVMGINATMRLIYQALT